MRVRTLAALITAISMIFGAPVALASSGHATSFDKKCGKTKEEHTNCGKHKGKGK